MNVYATPPCPDDSLAPVYRSPLYASSKNMLSNNESPSFFKRKFDTSSAIGVGKALPHPRAK